MSKKPPYHDRVAEGIIQALKDGTAPWIKPWKPGEIVVPFNPTSQATYRGINAVNLALPGYADPRWLTYRQALAQGWQVRKGSQGTSIQYWKFAEQKERSDNEGETTSKNRDAERPSVFYSHVFNASQIDGIPEWEPVERPWKDDARAEALLSGSGATLHHDQRDKAFYRPTTDEIHLPPREQFPTSEAYYATALHELGHWTGHASRLDRDMVYPLGSEGYAREELRAEISSYLVAGELGLGHDPGQHMAYIDHWIAMLEKDSREIFRACADAEKIKTFVMAPEQEKAKEPIAPADTLLREQTTTAGPEFPALEHTTAERIYLAVPYEEKDAAKALGARWDRKNKVWFAEPGADLAAFKRWQVEAGTPPKESPEVAFGRACTDMGLDLNGPPIMDGQLHRVRLTDDRVQQRSGAYVGHLDGLPAGYIENFRTGEKQNWHHDHALNMAPEERAQMMAVVASKREARAKERLAEQERVADKAQEKIDSLHPMEKPTPYMVAKGIALEPGALTDEAGVKTYLPLRDSDGKIWSLQTIDAEGNKRFLKGGRKEGCYFVAGESPKQRDMCWVAEGFATAASVSQAINEPVIVAFDAGNLKAVSETLHQQDPGQVVCILSDRDDVGWEKAQVAANAVDGIAVRPTFAPPETGKAFTDWNDLATKSAGGISALREQLLAARAEQQGREATTEAPKQATDEARKAELRTAYLHVGKREAITEHPEIAPVYKFEAAATQFVAANHGHFTQETGDIFVERVRENALDVLARGGTLPTDPRPILPTQARQRSENDLGLER